jgi:anti-sigma B factor antagonist
LLLGRTTVLRAPENHMELTYDDLSDGIRTIKLKGRMDLEGTAAIDLKFTSLTSTQRAFVVVDLTEVDFMASLGLATLVRNAKAVRLREGNMVLLNPKPSVRQVLASTRIDQFILIYSDLTEARHAAKAPPSAIK